MIFQHSLIYHLILHIKHGSACAAQQIDILFNNNKNMHYSLIDQQFVRYGHVTNFALCNTQNLSKTNLAALGFYRNIFKIA